MSKIRGQGPIDAVAASTSQLIWSDVLNWFREVSAGCTDRGAWNAFGDVLTLFEGAWSQEMAAPTAGSSERQEVLLLNLSEVGNVHLHLRVSDPLVRRAASVVYVRTFLQIVRSAIESGDAEAAGVSIEYFMHGSAPGGSSLDPVTGAGLLALYAWLLARFDTGERDASFAPVCRQMDVAFHEEPSVLPILGQYDEL